MSTKLLVRFAVIFFLVGCGLILLSRDQTRWAEQLLMDLGCHSLSLCAVLVVVEWYLREQSVKAAEGEVWQSGPGKAVKEGYDGIRKHLLESASDMNVDKLTTIIDQYRNASTEGVSDHDRQSIARCVKHDGPASPFLTSLNDPRHLHQIGRDIPSLKQDTDAVADAVKRFTNKSTTADDKEIFAGFMEMWTMLEGLLKKHKA